MSALFVTRPGSVVAIQGENAVPMAIFLEGWPGFPAIQAIVTGVRGNSQGGVQFSHTQLDAILIYAFCERVGDVQISGVAFTANCEGLGMSGVEQVAMYYGQNRATARGGPIAIQIGLSGASRLQGFLLGQQSEFVDADRQLTHFTLHFKTLTPESSRPL